MGGSEYYLGPRLADPSRRGNKMSIDRGLLPKVTLG